LVAIGEDGTVSGSMINGEFVSAGEMMVRGTSKSSITIEGMSMTRNQMRPIHPSEILQEEFLVPLGMTAHALSQAIHVPATRVNDIVNGKRGVKADTALRLARYFGNSPEFWLNLQATHNLRGAEGDAAARIEREAMPRHGMNVLERRLRAGCVAMSSCSGLRLRPMSESRYRPLGRHFSGSRSMHQKLAEMRIASRLAETARAATSPRCARSSRAMPARLNW
jgi:addiction module HigA family antidote